MQVVCWFPKKRCRIFSLVILLSMLCVTGTSAREVTPLSPGTSAPSFELPGVDGKNHSVDEFKSSKLLVVIFTCNHCPTAQAYEDRIIAIYDEYKSQDVAFVAISPNSAEAVRLDELGYTDLGDSLEDMKLRAERKGFEFPYLYDGETQAVSEAFGVLATPHVYVFDESRVLRYVGRIDDNEIGEPKRHDLRIALDELIAGKDVSVPETPVFGCSTKWKDKIPSAEEAVKKWNTETAELKLIEPKPLQEYLYGKAEKYRLVNVWATWCIPCIEELDQLVEMHRMYRKRPFELITISADDPGNQDKAEQLLSSKHCSATNFILQADSRDDLFKTVDTEWKGAVPYTMLISPAGEVVHRVHGELDAMELKRVIADHIGRTYAADKK